MRRMDRYQEEKPNRVSRMDKNQDLYQNLSSNQIYTNITDVTNANAYEIPTIISSGPTTREAYQTIRKYQNVETIPRNKKELEDFKSIYRKNENKIYDINSVIEEARKNRGDSLKEESKRKLKDNRYNILLSDQKALEKYREEKKKRILTPEEEDLREIINTIATKTLAGELDKETTVDLLSDLMATNAFDKVEGASTIIEKVEEDENSIEEQHEEEVEKQEEIVEKEIKVEEEKKEEDDFYSKSMELTDGDFELSDEFKEKDLPVALKVFIFFIVIVIVGIAGFFIFQRFH